MPRSAMAGTASPISPSQHPTYASWLNQKVSELIERIERYTAKWNANAHPFVWTAAADSILAKIKRLCERISADTTLIGHTQSITHHPGEIVHDQPEPPGHELTQDQPVEKRSERTIGFEATILQENRLGQPSKKDRKPGRTHHPIHTNHKSQRM